MLMNKTISVGRLYACFAPQGAGSPLIDKCCTLEKDEPKRIGFGWLIRLPFMGERPTIGLTVGKWNKTPNAQLKRRP